MKYNGHYIPILISVHGINDRMLHTLEYLFQGQGKDNYQITADEQSAHLRILDADTVAGKKLYKEKLRVLLDKPVIILSVNKLDIKEAITLQKPLKTDELISALQLISRKKASYTQKKFFSNTAINKGQAQKKTATAKQKPKKQLTKKRIDKVTKSKTTLNREPTVSNKQNNSKKNPPEISKEQIIKTSKTKNNSFQENPGEIIKRRHIGYSPDIDLNDHRKILNIQYDPDTYFQGYLTKTIQIAKFNNAAIRLKLPRGSIVVLPDAHTVLLNITESRLQTYCSVPISEGTLSRFFLDVYQLKDYKKSATPDLLNALVWKTAIWASRGRLPEQTNINKKIHLKDWHEISDHLLTFEHAEKIAHVWTQKPYSLLDIATELNIPQRFIFTFYSACNAIGIMPDDAHKKSSLLPLEPSRLDFINRLFTNIKNTKNT